jgi:hypothetical protein
VKDVIILEMRLKLLSKEHRNISNTEKTFIALKQFIKGKKFRIHKLTKAPIKLNVVEQLPYQASLYS